MKIIFIGNVLFSKFLLEFILKQKNIDVIGVCTKNTSNFNADFYNLGNICKKKNIDFIYCDKINDKKNVEWIKKKKPDYIFCFGWSQLLSKEILNIPKKNVIGYHPSILPNNRGRHPIIWSLVLGLKFTGSSFFIMNDKADKGEIISQKKIYIANKDDAKKLYTKLVNSALKQLKFFLPKLENKKKIFLKKNKFNIGNYWRKRSEIDGQIDWRMNAKNIYNLTRALTKPYPFSHFIFKKKKINVLKAKIIKYKNLNIEPGKILKFKNDKYITIKCGEDALKIIKFKPRISFRKVKYII